MNRWQKCKFHVKILRKRQKWGFLFCHTLYLRRHTDVVNLRKPFYSQISLRLKFFNCFIYLCQFIYLIVYLLYSCTQFIYDLGHRSIRLHSSAANSVMKWIVPTNENASSDCSAPSRRLRYVVYTAGYVVNGKSGPLLLTERSDQWWDCTVLLRRLEARVCWLLRASCLRCC